MVIITYVYVFANNDTISLRDLNRKYKIVQFFMKVYFHTDT